MDPVSLQARLRRRARLQAIFGVVCAVLTVLAAVVPAWIEETTTFEPDGGSGLVEWMLAVVFGAASVALGVLSYHTRVVLRRTSA